MYVVTPLSLFQNVQFKKVGSFHTRLIRNYVLLWFLMCGGAFCLRFSIVVPDSIGHLATVADPRHTPPEEDQYLENSWCKWAIHHFMHISVLPQEQFKAWWEGRVWVELTTTSKHLDSPFPHQRYICTEGLLGQCASSVLGRTLMHAVACVMS